MENLTQLMDYIQDNMPNSTDKLTIARYVYIELGKYFCFDPMYIVGNNEARNKIYGSISMTESYFDEMISEKLCICKSLAYIYEYIMRTFGINVLSILDGEDEVHVNNILYLNNKNTFLLNLQGDLQYIQTGSRTLAFGKKKEELYSTLNADTISNIDYLIGYTKAKGEYNNFVKNFDISILQGLNLAEQIAIIFNHLYATHDFTNVGIVECQKYLNFIFLNLLGNNAKNMHYAYCYHPNNKEAKYVFIISAKCSKCDCIYFLKDKKYVQISNQQVKSMLIQNLKIRFGSIYMENKVVKETTKFL